MALLCTPVAPILGAERALGPYARSARSRMVNITCTGCDCVLVVAATGDRLRRIVPRLERVHTCAEALS